MTQKEAKKKTRIVSAVLFSIMVVSMLCVIGLTPPVYGLQVESEISSYKETNPNYYASLVAGKLLGTFYATLPNGTGVLNYPVEYAGAYIDPSNNLHIVLSKYATNTTIDTYLSIIGDPDVIFETQEFPLSRLYEAQNAIGPAMGTFRIDVAGANEITNRLELNLEDSTKQSDIIAYLDSKVAGFDERCVTFLGPNPITLTGEEITPSAVPADGFLGTNIPMIYGVTAVAIIAVMVALVCYLAFVRQEVKPQSTSDN